MNRIEAIIASARDLRDLVVDTTPSSLTGSSLDIARLVHPADRQLIGRNVYIYSGGGSGQDRVIGTYLAPVAGRDGRTVFTRFFSPIASTNSNLIITKFWDKLEYDSALDRAIGKARMLFLEDSVATLQLVGSQYEYPVPSGLEWISTLRLVPSGNSDYKADIEVDRFFEIPPRMFRIEQNPTGSYLIVINPQKINIGASLDEEWVRVLGQSKPVVSGTDNATIPVDLEEYVVAKVSMLLSSQRIEESQEWRTKFTMFRDEVRGRGNDPGLEDYIVRVGRGKKVR